MDRFSIFYHIKQIVKKSYSIFNDFPFNPIDVLVSQLYIEAINQNYKKGKDRVIYSKLSLLTKIKMYAQIKLRPIKDWIVPKSIVSIKTLRNPILFFPVDFTHIVQFEPIWDVLESKTISYIIITNRKIILKIQKKKNRNVILIRTSQGISERKHYKNMLIVLEQFLSNDFFNDTEKNFIRDIVNEVIQKRMKIIWNLSERINQILEKFSPCCVVPGYDITPEGRLLTFLARNRNIPSYCIMHGSITGEPLDTVHIVDHFCLFGEASKRDLIAKGVDPAQLIVTGAPYLDKFEHKQRGIHSLLKQNLSLTESKPYFFIATSGPGHSTSHDHFQLILENIFEVAARYPDAQWVIKMHRKDRIENYQEVLSRYKNHHIHIVENTAPGFPQSIFEWLQGATALLTGTSTVALEAMSMGIPVVTMDFMDEYKMVDFIDLETTIHVTNQETLISVIRQLTEAPHVFETINERAKAYVAQYFYKSEISASENIVNHITANIKTPGRCVE